jgi:hypothetical protein
VSCQKTTIHVSSRLNTVPRYLNLKIVTYFSGEEYVKSLTANPELIDRLAYLSDEMVCFSMICFEKMKI